ncbi:transposase family protein [Actinophytocola sp.]|uniref:transposase family protein n=1 Tax=Actinophytocola sp. TaxID=1872138 RepID=UPI003D6BB1C7
MDGRLFSTDRLGEKTTSVKGEQIDAWYSGKHREPGGNVQALMEPTGFPLWLSEVEPGSTHDITAAREHVLGALYWAYSHLDLPTLADGGYAGAGIGVHTPIKQPAGNQEFDVDNHTYNSCSVGCAAWANAPFALLVGGWHALDHITTSPRKIGTIVKAALVPTHFEHGRLNKSW